MIKELVTIEFRYRVVPEGAFGGNGNKTITIGVFDTFDEAIVEGNKALEVFEKKFKLNSTWNRKERFSKKGGVFGTAVRLITNSAYLRTPFDFYAKITKLDYEDVEQTIVNVLLAGARYNEFKKQNQD